MGARAGGAGALEESGEAKKAPLDRHDRTVDVSDTPLIEGCQCRWAGCQVGHQYIFPFLFLQRGTEHRAFDEMARDVHIVEKGGEDFVVGGGTGADELDPEVRALAKGVDDRSQGGDCFGEVG